MKQDRMMTLMGVLALIMSLLSFSVGSWIMGGIILLLAFGIFWNRGFGKFNDRSIYEKVIRTDLTIQELYGKIRDLDTPLGRAWIGGHKGFEGDSIIFGPDAFKDCVVISRRKDYLDVKHITLLDNITRSSEDEKRFTGLINTAETKVTPKSYSLFAAFKLASVMLVKHLTDIIEKLDADRSAAVPDQTDIFRFFYHNSSEGYFRDGEGNNILKVENSHRPFTARVLDAEGVEEMARGVPRAFNRRGETDDSAGYDLYADGEHYGEISKIRMNGGDSYIVRAGSEEFLIKNFPACLRANISSNYIIEKDGEVKAVIGGSPNILFEEEGRCENDVILSYDDDYLVLYAIMAIFIMTVNKKFLK